VWPKEELAENIPMPAISFVPWRLRARLFHSVIEAGLETVTGFIRNVLRRLKICGRLQIFLCHLYPTIFFAGACVPWATAYSSLNSSASGQRRNGAKAFWKNTPNAFSPPRNFFLLASSRLNSYKKSKPYKHRYNYAIHTS